MMNCIARSRFIDLIIYIRYPKNLAFHSILLRPFVALADLLWPNRGLDLLNGRVEISDYERWFFELAAGDLVPFHWHGAPIVGIAGGEPLALLVVNLDGVSKADCGGSSRRYLFEVCRSMDPLDRQHQRILNHIRNITPRKPIRPHHQIRKRPLRIAKRSGHVPKMDLEQLLARLVIRERDVDALLEAAPDGGVQGPGEVRRGEEEDAVVVVAEAVHLDEEFGLEAGCVLGVGGAAVAVAAEGVDFIDEDDGGFLFPREGEELSH